MVTLVVDPGTDCMLPGICQGAVQFVGLFQSVETEPYQVAEDGGEAQSDDWPPASTAIVAIKMPAMCLPPDTNPNMCFVVINLLSLPNRMTSHQLHGLFLILL